MKKARLNKVTQEQPKCLHCKEVIHWVLRVNVKGKASMASSCKCSD